MNPSPRQTADDLRRAAQAVTDFGYARYHYVNAGGQLCAAGAIGVATGHFIRYTIADGKTFDYRQPDIFAQTSEAEHRFLSAMTAIAPLLPTTCPGDCMSHSNLFCAHEPGEHCSRVDEYHTILADSVTNERVYHFNDYICQGGDELSTLFTQAAEKIEADL